MKTGRDNFIQGLRDLADFYENTPEFPCEGYCTIDLFVADKDELSRLARLMGKGDKSTLGEWFVVSRRFGPVKIEINANREKVCTRRVVRTEIVPAHHVPAMDVAEKVVEVFEWDCPDSILRETAEVLA